MSTWDTLSSSTDREVAGVALERVNTARLALGREILERWDAETLDVGCDPVGKALGCSMFGEHLAVEFREQADAERVAFVWGVEARYRPSSAHCLSAVTGAILPEGWAVDVPPPVGIFAERVTRWGMNPERVR